MICLRLQVVVLSGENFREASGRGLEHELAHVQQKGVICVPLITPEAGNEYLKGRKQRR